MGPFLLERWRQRIEWHDVECPFEESDVEGISGCEEGEASLFGCVAGSYGTITRRGVLDGSDGHPFCNQKEDMDGIMHSVVVLWTLSSLSVAVPCWEWHGSVYNKSASKHVKLWNRQNIYECWLKTIVNLHYASQEDGISQLVVYIYCPSVIAFEDQEYIELKLLGVQDHKYQRTLSLHMKLDQPKPDVAEARAHLRLSCPYVFQSTTKLK